MCYNRNFWVPSVNLRTATATPTRKLFVAEKYGNGTRSEFTLSFQSTRALLENLLALNWPTPDPQI